MIERDIHSSIAKDFEADLAFYLGPAYKEVAAVIEQEKTNRLTDNVFMAIMTLIITIVSSLVIYRLFQQVKARIEAKQVEDVNPSQARAESIE